MSTKRKSCMINEGEEGKKRGGEVSMANHQDELITKIIAVFRNPSSNYNIFQIEKEIRAIIQSNKQEWDEENDITHYLAFLAMNKLLGSNGMRFTKFLALMRFLVKQWDVFPPCRNAFIEFQSAASFIIKAFSIDVYFQYIQEREAGCFILSHMIKHFRMFILLMLNKREGNRMNLLPKLVLNNLLCYLL